MTWQQFYETYKPTLDELRELIRRFEAAAMYLHKHGGENG